MYWPNGVPRVYAVNGPGISFSSSAVDEIFEDETSQSRERSADEPAQGPRVGSKSTAWEDEVIDGLCVSRSGHLFATITKSSIAVWQTRVNVLFSSAVFLILTEY
jgi:hypothetical protein